MSCSICNGLPDCPCCEEPGDTMITDELEICDNCGEECESISLYDGWQFCDECKRAHEEQLKMAFEIQEP